MFDVLQPVKDGNGDLATRMDDRLNRAIALSPDNYGAFYDVQPVSESLTIFRTAPALGCKALFKPKSSKKTVS